MNVRNRKCIRKLSFRTLWASRKRNLIAILAIVLTTLLFTSLFTIALSINRTYEMYTFRQIGGYPHGSYKQVTDEEITAIASHRNIQAVGERTHIGYIGTGVFAKVPAEVSFMDKNCTQWSFASPIEGHIPQSVKEITMDTNALALLGIEPELGAEVTLTFTVGDQYQYAYDKTDTFTLVGWWEYDNIMPVHYINISEEYADFVEAEGKSNGLLDFRTDLNVMLRSEINIEGQLEQVINDLGLPWETEQRCYRIGVNWGYTSANVKATADESTVIAILAFLMLVIFTGFLIIYNIFQISVTGDIRFYGLLKTIGVTPRQLKRIIRQQALLMCIVGIPVGIILGYGVGVALLPTVMEQSIFGTASTMVSSSPMIFAASAVFTLITVLLSCAKPGKMAAKVSPVEAAKYVENTAHKKKKRTTRGAKIHQMAFANLGRNKRKTALVMVSLALAVVLLNILVTFTGGFDMEKYLSKKSCADFIVSSTGYFRDAFHSETFITEEQIIQIQENTTQSLSGSGYKVTGALGWMTEDAWRMDRARIGSPDTVERDLAQAYRRGDLVGPTALIEGLDEPLFEKLTVVEGDLAPLFQPETKAIAMVVYTDDYGNVSTPDYYPPVGSTQTITYVEKTMYIDSRTGEEMNENTPMEYIQSHITKSHDIDYTICAYVTLPTPMSYRYTTIGYRFVLPVDRLAEECGREVIPMFWLFDTPDLSSEESAENYLAKLTEDPQTELMYESKAKMRDEFYSFQIMFLLLGGLLCAVITLIGILNFINAIMTGILSRKREFAVLQAVGMTNKQLKSMLIYEGLFYALGSSVAALILSILLNPLIGKMLESMFWFFSANFTIIPVLLVIPVFALFGWLIPSILYGQAAKQSVVERLRESEA